MADLKTSILLVRHGTTAWNEEDRLQGRIDNPLGDRGRDQAARLAARLLREPPGAAFVSPLRRARETAEILLAGRDLPLTVVPEFAEIDLGEWEGQLYPEMIAAQPDLHRRWLEDPAVALPGGESFQSVYDRVGPGLARVLAGPTTRILVVGHAAVNRAILGHLLGLSARQCRHFRTANASLSRLLAYDRDGRRWAVADLWNCTAHLEAPA